MGLRSTRIQSDTGEVYTLPNGTISEIVNYSKTDVSPLLQFQFLQMKIMTLLKKN